MSSGMDEIRGFSRFLQLGLGESAGNQARLGVVTSLRILQHAKLLRVLEVGDDHCDLDEMESR
jgi:hypothetical protein